MTTTIHTQEPGTQRSVLAVGTPVEVRSRFDQRWARGFCIHAVDDDAYQLRRNSDGAVLPARFARDDVRALSPR
jgi:hypothetical protein